MVIDRQFFIGGCRVSLSGEYNNGKGMLLSVDQTLGEGGRGGSETRSLNNDCVGNLVPRAFSRK